MNMDSARILVVENDPHLALALELLFSQHGFMVEVVNSGELALERVVPFAPHVVVMEARLPFRSSFDVSQALLKADLPVRPKILLLTVKEREAEAAKGTALGIHAFLVKPFSSRQMLDVVKGLIG
jgi:DNA-binding response OmpR family regulator